MARTSLWICANNSVANLIDLQCASYQHESESIPALSLSASRDAQGNIPLTICNLDPQRDLGLECEIHGFEPVSVTGRVLTAQSINDHNTAAQPESVKPAPFDGVNVAGRTLRLDLPAKSVVGLEIA